MPEYSSRERAAFIGLGGFGLVVLNGLFLSGLLIQPESFLEAFTNPISLVFMIESFLLLGLFAYLMNKWGVLRLRWGWFVVLALLGSMLFALPIVLLWGRNRTIRANGKNPEWVAGVQ